MSLSFDLLPWMDDETRAAFAVAVRHRRFTTGQLIYLQGDIGREMYRIQSGSVRLSLIRDDGRELVLLFFRPGDCFGVSSLVDAGPRPQTAEALTDIELEVIDVAAYDHLRARHRSFDDALLKLLSAQMRAATAHYADRSFTSLPSRVISWTLLSARSFSANRDGDVALRLRLSQSELALMVGAARQHVNKVLKQLERDALVSVE